MATGVKTSVYVSHSDHARWKAMPHVGAAEVFKKGLDAIEAEQAAQDGTGPVTDPLGPLMDVIRAGVVEALNDEGLIVWPERMAPPPKAPDARKIPRAPRSGLLRREDAG